MEKRSGLMYKYIDYGNQFRNIEADSIEEIKSILDSRGHGAHGQIYVLKDGEYVATKESD